MSGSKLYRTQRVLKKPLTQLGGMNGKVERQNWMLIWVKKVQRPGAGRICCVEVQCT